MTKITAQATAVPEQPVAAAKPTATTSIVAPAPIVPTETTTMGANKVKPPPPVMLSLNQQDGSSSVPMTVVVPAEALLLQDQL
jgi:hypothetical protein